MDHASFPAFSLETMASPWIHAVGLAIDAVGVAIIVIGIAASTFRFLQRRRESEAYQRYKISLGRSLLLGLEMLVAADIVKTIAIEPTFVSLGVLAGLVAVRTFLGWTLVLEIEGTWPWRTAPARAARTAGNAGARAFGE